MGTKALAGASGYHGRISQTGSQGGLVLCVTEYNLQEIAAEEETTNSCSAGIREYDYGPIYVEGTIEADLDLTQHPFGSPPSFAPGEDVLNVDFFESVAPDGGTVNGEAARWTFDKITIGQATVTCPAASKVHYSFNFKSTGPYTITGSGYNITRGF